MSAGLPLPWFTPKPPTITASGLAATMVLHETNVSRLGALGIGLDDHQIALPPRYASQSCHSPLTTAPWFVLYTGSKTSVVNPPGAAPLMSTWMLMAATCCSVPALRYVW